jgi:hypothetical protein
VILVKFSPLSLRQLLKNYIQDAYQERLRDMARRSLDNLPALLILFWRSKERCQFQPDKIGIDKSALKLKNSLQYIQSSPDLSGELFVL